MLEHQLPRRRRDVDCDTPLAEAVMPEVEAPFRVLHVVDEWADSACWAALGWLDLDDVGAGAGEHLAAELASLIGEFEHVDAGEERRHAQRVTPAQTAAGSSQSRS